MRLPDFLAETTPEAILTVLAAVAAAAMVGAVWSAALVRDPVSGRARTLKARRESLRGDLLRPRHNSFRRDKALGFVNHLNTKLNLLRTKHVAQITLRLAQAGWRSKDALSIYLFAKLCLPLVLGSIAVAVLYGTAIFSIPPLGKMAVSMMTVILGGYAPEIFVKNATQKRRVAIQKGLPDGLDLLVICAEAGLGLEGALNRVASEMARSAPELADEFGLTAIELGFLPVRRTALENLMRRVELPSIRGVVNTLLQTEKYGTPLAQSLRVLSAEFRDERMLKAEEKAAKLPATLTVPLVVFIMPTLFIVLLGPAILRTIDGLGGL